MSEKVVTISGEQTELAVERNGAKVRAGEHEIEILAVHAEDAELRIDGRTRVVPFVVQGTQISFSLDGEIWVADVSDKGARTKAKHRDHSMSAPMPGVVLKILTTAGAEVTRGTPLLILEAMKMEHQIVASKDGKVAKINCTEGELVQPGVELIELA